MQSIVRKNPVIHAWLFATAALADSITAEVPAFKRVNPPDAPVPVWGFYNSSNQRVIVAVGNWLVRDEYDELHCYTDEKFHETFSFVADNNEPGGGVSKSLTGTIPPIPEPEGAGSAVDPKTLSSPTSPVPLSNTPAVVSTPSSSPTQADSATGSIGKPQ